MKRLTTAGAAMAILSLIAAVESAAQRPERNGGGWGSGTAYDRIYDPATVETIRGEVVSTDRIAPMQGMSYGIHVVVRTATETIAVHLGPAWFLDNLDAGIAPGDRIEVRGSRVSFDGKAAIIAAGHGWRSRLERVATAVGVLST